LPATLFFPNCCASTKQQQTTYNILSTTSIYTLLARLFLLLINTSSPPHLNFEATICESRLEAEIVAPTEGSEQATVVALAAGSTVADEASFRWVGDNYEGFNWSRYPKHCVPATTLSPRAS